MSRVTTPHPRRRPLTALALAATAVLTLTACGGGENSEDHAGAPTKTAEANPKGLLTEQDAKKAVDTYEQVNNRANAKQDPELLSTVEAGQLYKQSKADFEQWETWSEKDQKYYTSSFYYKERKYLIPAADSGATWFAVQAVSSADKEKNDALLIFDKVGSTYKLTMSVYAEEEPIPDIAVDKHGFVTPIDPSRKIGALAPNQLGDAYEDFFETGGKTAGKTFAPTDTSKGSIEVHKEGPSEATKNYATEKFFAEDAAHPKVYGLKLANGGALALFPTGHTSELVLKPQYMSAFDLTPSEKESVYDSTKRDLITNEFQGQALAILSPNSKPRVTAIEYRLVDSR
ncbi:hypothetical protein [Streptomyces sp. NPDC045251]|uniref:hypothetical protein n=1 Tax=unclassified Streptomyces TaxID=2593676 RepID=UPI0034053A9B